MPENRDFHLLDYVDFLVKRKELLILVFLASLLLSYLLILIFVEEQYEANAVIIPRTDDASSLSGGILRSMKALPFGLGAKSPRTDLDLYNTVITSRSMMEDVINTFHLVQVYGLDTSSIDHRETAIKWLRNDIVTKQTDELAYVLTVRAGTRERASEMANYIIRRLNERIVELNVTKSRENKEFLAGRVDAIATQLRLAEDSLRAYQERTGLLDVKSQLQGIVAAHTSLESELAAKRIQQGILEKMYDKESPQVQEAGIQIAVFEKKLQQMRSESDPGSPLLPLKQLPRTVVEYLRRYRAVELNALLMEYILPLYEQAKLEEKKEYPLIQIIDNAVPPAKKSWPPRMLFSFICAASATILVYVVLLVRASFLGSTDPRWLTVMAHGRHWAWPKRMPH
jgi:tyrosine-protein kinase Etk/Wzc